MGERIIQQQMHAIRLARLQQPKAQEASIDISEPAGLPQQISLWLVPPDCLAMPPNAHSSRMSLVEVSSKLARQHKLPGSMEPHITIIGDVGLHAEEARSRLKSLKGSGPVACTFERITAAEKGADGKVPWHQSCVAVVKATPALLALQRKCRAALLGETPPRNTWAPPLSVPHLSLAYAANNELCNVNFGASPAPHPFVATALVLYATSDPEISGGSDPYQSYVGGKWMEVGRVEL